MINILNVHFNFKNKKFQNSLINSTDSFLKNPFKFDVFKLTINSESLSQKETPFSYRDYSPLSHPNFNSNLFFSIFRRVFLSLFSFPHLVQLCCLFLTHPCSASINKLAKIACFK